MSRIGPSARLRDRPPEDDPFRYGWRYVTLKLPNGRTTIDQVPLTLEDVLHPQEGDVIPENTQQERDRRYLHDVLEKHYADDPTTLTLSDCLVDWGIPSIRPHSPDLTVLEGVATKEGAWGTYRLARDKGRPVLVAEIVSPHTRGNDVQIKRQHYHRVGVPFYLLVDQEVEGGPRELLAYRHTRRGYVRVRPDAEGRVPLGPTGILVALEGDRVVCIDPETGRELGDYTRVCQQLEDEIAARREAEQRADEEAAARQAAEQRADEEAAARRKAEQGADEEAAARQAAEQRAKAEEEARRAAEARVRELERQLRRRNHRQK
jgi:Uma2 family endonuclease